MENHPERIKLI